VQFWWKRFETMKKGRKGLNELIDKLANQLMVLALFIPGTKGAN